MNPPIKRLLAFAGSVVAGLFGAIVLASPAQAHHPLISGESSCEADGRYKIKWTVGNGDWDNPYMKIVQVTPTPSANSVSNITVGTWLDPDEEVIGFQYVPGNTTEAKLYIDARWYRNKTDTWDRVHNNRTGTVELNGTCRSEPNPSVTFDDRCDGTINVKLVNPTSTMKSFRINGSKNNYSQTVEVAANGQPSVPVPASAGALTVSVKNGGSTWTEIGKTPEWSRPGVEECPPPTVFSWSDCDNFRIAVTNPQNAPATTATVTYGDEDPDARPVAAGTTENFEFTPSTSTQATVELTGWDTQTMTYKKPPNCETLPKTGSNTTTYIASGSGLAMLGALAFFFARRRMARLRKLASM